MSYNVRVTRFGNGTCEIAVYKQGVRELSDAENAYMADVMSAKDSLYRDNTEYVYNPFTHKVEVASYLENLAYEKQRREHSMITSLNRTRSALYGYSRQCKWKYFITLTFSPDMIDRYDFTVCMTKARVWFNHCRQRKAPKLKYLIVPERHKDGAWHIHGLICDSDGLMITDSGKRHKGQIIYNLSDWRYGFSTATAVTDTYRVSAYIVKYISKELCSVTAGKQRYYVSKSIPKPEVVTDLIDPGELDSYIQTVADSLGADLEYQKSVSGYLDVDYKYYKVKEKEEEKK